MVYLHLWRQFSTHGNQLSSHSSLSTPSCLDWGRGDSFLSPILVTMALSSWQKERIWGREREREGGRERGGERGMT